MDSPLSDTLLEYLLGAADGGRFERLVQELLAIRDGENFVALGGVHDGGADGLLRGTYDDPGRSGNFVQISLQENVSQEIRGTVKRLREVGREVRSVAYWAGVRIPELDLLEVKLSKELGVTVRIKDRLAFFRLANYDKRTQALIQAQFRAEIFELSSQAKSLSERHAEFAKDPSVFVFLQFETGDRFSKGGMVAPIVDALIYWALRDTDPDSSKLLSREQLKARIADLIPGALANLIPNVDGRLQVLTNKSATGTQRVRAYTADDSFCLPYDMRVELASANADEQAMQTAMRGSLKGRAVAAEL
jgi:hypothetical protein